MAKANLKRDWQPDKAAFDRLLAWLDEGTESRGERYLEMRERLVDYFGRRDCPFPEDLADETLNRVARRLEETGSIDDVVPARYCYIVAKFVFLESLRRPATGRACGSERRGRRCASGETNAQRTNARLPVWNSAFSPVRPPIVP